MDRLISLDPSNLVPIRIEPGEKCHGQITLRNVMYTMPVAFRLQPLIKTRYTVKPHSGIISPLATLTVEITYHLPPGSILPHSFPHSDDSFLLHSVVVPGAATKEPSSMFEAVPNDWFTARKKQVFIDSGIKVIFLGSPILTHLIEHGSMDEIREVLECSDPSWKSVDSTDPQGNTLLHLAISQKRPDLVQLLLEFKPNIESVNTNCARSGSGDSVSTTTPLELACSLGEALIVELLLANKANTERAESSTWGPVHLAAREGNVEVLRLLLLKGADVDSRAKDGNTALHLAVEERRRDCVKLLLANGARTDIRNGRDGDTALHVAAVTGEESVIRTLLQKGANKDVKNGQGKTAYDVAAENGQKRVFDALRLGDGLCVAARKGEVGEVVRLLEGGAVVNGRDQNGWTALHRACFKGRVEAVRVLLEKGAEVDAADRDGYTALHCAAEAGYADVAEVLVKKGVDVEARTNKGVTALQIAETLHYVGITRILLNSGASSDGLDQMAQSEKMKMVKKKMKKKRVGRRNSEVEHSMALAVL